jgi:hypothetical protein
MLSAGWALIIRKESGEAVALRSSIRIHFMDAQMRTQQPGQVYGISSQRCKVGKVVLKQTGGIGLRSNGNENTVGGVVMRDSKSATAHTSIFRRVW